MISRSRLPSLIIRQVNQPSAFSLSSREKFSIRTEASGWLTPLRTRNQIELFKMIPQLIPSQKCQPIFFNKNSSDPRCLAETEASSDWRPGGKTESSIFFSWNFWILLHLLVLSSLFCLQQNITWQHTVLGRHFSVVFWSFNISDLNFQFCQISLLTKCSSWYWLEGGGRTSVSFVSDQQRKSQTTEIYSFYSLVGEWNSTKGQRPKRFTKLIWVKLCFPFLRWRWV